MKHKNKLFAATVLLALSFVANAQIFSSKSNVRAISDYFGHKDWLERGFGVSYNGIDEKGKGCSINLKKQPVEESAEYAIHVSRSDLNLSRGHFMILMSRNSDFSRFSLENGLLAFSTKPIALGSGRNDYRHGGGVLISKNNKFVGFELTGTNPFNERIMVKCRDLELSTATSADP